jgi:hypothetical protein
MHIKVWEVLLYTSDDGRGKVVFELKVKLYFAILSGTKVVTDKGKV